MAAGLRDGQLLLMIYKLLESNIFAVSNGRNPFVTQGPIGIGVIGE